MVEYDGEGNSGSLSSVHTLLFLTGYRRVIIQSPYDYKRKRFYAYFCFLGLLIL